MRSSARLVLAAASALAAALALGAAPVRAQAALVQAFDLEQQGRYAEAGEAFRTVLLTEPANLAALLGAERAFAQIGLRDTVVALTCRALAADSANRIFHLVLLRTYHALRADSAANAAFERWVAVAPRDVAPYRERARLFLAEGRDGEVRTLAQRARARLGDPVAVAPELAQVELRAGSPARAAEEWRAAVTRDGAQVEPAVFGLRTALPDERDGVLRVLAGGEGPSAGRDVAVGLLLAWNEPRRAWTTLRQGLPAAGPSRTAALRRFADGAGRLEGREARRVAAEALELAAAGQQGLDASRTLVESARAYAAAGDGVAARRLLLALAAGTGTPPALALSARATLVDLAAGEGNADEAERLLDAERDRLPVREAQRLARRVAFAHLRGGRPDRALAAVAADSSLAGDEVRGWVAVYRGDLRTGAATLRRVGADAGDPARAGARAAAVSLVTSVARDSLPALGAALLRAESGDTLGAARALAAEGRRLEGEGRAATLLWAARLAASAADTAGAEVLWEEIVATVPASPASAAALLALARVAAARGRLGTAAERLEALILRHPESALVPEARRELDRVRGVVPRS